MTPNNPFSINAKGIIKRFNSYTVFKDISFYISAGNSLAITGANGSGKSTLLEIIAGIQKPTKGRIEYQYNGQEITHNDLITHIGFASPKMNLYNELTGLENIQFVLESDKSAYVNVDNLLKRFDLHIDQDKSVKYYSSGMKQRLKLLLAIIRNPTVLLLDEPGSNLDAKGKETIYSFLEYMKEKKLIIIATNEEEEACICNDRIDLGK
ncbi:MAG: ABC transporter ATP-binding protein [Spirochaetota bacterium]|nr:ABC transporter ATP-binding protein [Spirochaetota bacterium]